MTHRDPTAAMTIADVARLLSCDAGTVRHAIRVGHLPAIKLGRVYRIFPEHLGAYIKSKLYTPPSHRRPRSYVDYSSLRERFRGLRNQITGRD